MPSNSDGEVHLYFRFKITVDSQEEPKSELTVNLISSNLPRRGTC